jgi:NAD-dependent deacetylase
MGSCNGIGGREINQMNTQAGRKKIVVLTGAGISAESGLKTFRDSDGLWEGYEVSEVATPGAWRRNPALVLEFYNLRRKNVLEASPNKAHYGLAELEKDFEVQIITQNIDDLHERAGSTQIIHLHGEIFKMRSESNGGLIYDIRGDIQWGDRAEDGAQLRPHIVWFEEPVPMIERIFLLWQEPRLSSILRQAWSTMQQQEFRNLFWTKKFLTLLRYKT